MKPQSFKPIKVGRDEPTKQQTRNNSEAVSDEDKDEPDKKQYHRPGYREAIMTDGILVDNLIEEINRLAETGTSDLGTVIFNCENAL